MTSSESGVFSSEIEIEVRAQIRRLIRHAERYYVNEPEIVKYSHVHRMVQEWFEGALAAELSADGTLPDVEIRELREAVLERVHRIVDEEIVGERTGPRRINAVGCASRDAHPPGSGGRSGHEGDDDSG